MLICNGHFENRSKKKNGKQAKKNREQRMTLTPISLTEPMVWIFGLQTYLFDRQHMQLVEVSLAHRLQDRGSNKDQRRRKANRQRKTGNKELL